MFCPYCKENGATVGCAVASCPHSYHLVCAKKTGCHFMPQRFSLACPDHAVLFREEGQQPRPRSPSPVRCGRKRSRSPDWPQEDLEEPGKPPSLDMAQVKAKVLQAHKVVAAARQAGYASSDDEVIFARKERRRWQKHVERWKPLILGKPQAPPGPSTPMMTQPRLPHTFTGSQFTPPNIMGGCLPAPSTPGVGPVPPAPGPQPTWVPKDGFGSVGGLPRILVALREMVLLPLIYPDIFGKLGLTPPRGILLYGAPGTGKTHVVRALAGECARMSPRPVAFFSCKGADCLGKFVGDAERTLRIIFDQAAKLAPSIIFLDEMDALVPPRSVSGGTTDQIYASVVSTLLALMDGVTDRGQVVVIGATNRPEGLDPALRRPGRFDREVYFGLPTLPERMDILKVHTRLWSPQPSDDIIKKVAASCEGYAGADLAVLCTSAVVAAVRRTHPDLLDNLECQLGIVPADNSTASPTCGNDSHISSAAGGTTFTLGTKQTTTKKVLFREPPASGDCESPKEQGPPLGLHPDSCSYQDKEEELVPVVSEKEDSPPEDCTWLGSIPVPPPPSSPLEGGFTFLRALGQWKDDLQKGQAGLALGSWWCSDGHGKSSRLSFGVEDGGMVTTEHSTSSCGVGQEDAMAMRQEKDDLPASIGDPGGDLVGRGIEVADPSNRLVPETESLGDGTAGNTDVHTLTASPPNTSPPGTCTPLVSNPSRQCAISQSNCPADASLRDGGSGRGEHTAAGGVRSKAKVVLDDVCVLLEDWQEALALAPPPCSKRDPLVSSTLPPVEPVPGHLAALVVPSVRTLLRMLRDMGMRNAGMELATLQKIRVEEGQKAGDRQGVGEVDGHVVALNRCEDDLGVVAAGHTTEVVAPVDSLYASSRPLPMSSGTPLLPVRTIMETWRRMGWVEGHDFAASKPCQEPQSGDAGESSSWQSLNRSLCLAPSCRVLLASSGPCGQELTARLALRLMNNCSYHSVHLPSMLLQAQGDAVLGCVKLVQEAMRKATGQQLLVFYLPRVELWAISRPGEIQGSNLSASLEGGASMMDKWAPSSLASPGQDLNPVSAGTVVLPSGEMALAWEHQEQLRGGPSNSGFSSQAILISQRYAGSPSRPDNDEDHGDGGLQATPLWRVFEQTLKQVPPSQQTLVLATSHLQLSDMPTPILDFFDSRASSTVSEALGRANETLRQSAESQGDQDCTAPGSTSQHVSTSSSGVEEYEDVFRTSLREVAYLVAQDLRLALEAHLILHHKRSSPSSSAGRGENQEEGGHGISDSIAPGLSSSDQPEEIPLDKDNLAKAKPHKLEYDELNWVDKTAADGLLTQMRAAIIHCANTLMGYRALMARARGERPHGDMVTRLSFREVLEAAPRGRFVTIEEFVQALHSSAGAILRTLSTRRRYHSSSSATHMVVDMVDHWAEQTRQRLKLNTLQASALMEAAMQKRKAAAAAAAGGADGRGTTLKDTTHQGGQLHAALAPKPGCQAKGVVSACCFLLPGAVPARVPISSATRVGASDRDRVTQELFLPYWRAQLQQELEAAVLPLAWELIRHYPKEVGTWKMLEDLPGRLFRSTVDCLHLPRGSNLDRPGSTGTE